MPTAKQLAEGVKEPHDHDVLSGRGNFVNYHAGNEHFRGLVRKHKVEYVKCPKPQKGKFSRIIFDEVKSRNPPGRFLKQDPTTKLWYDIGEKKALDKTRQALREGAPDLMKDLSGESGEDDSDDDEVIARKKNTTNNNSFLQTMASPGGMFSNDTIPHPFMTNMSSPVMSRHGFNMSTMSIGMSPAIMSPGFLSPGMMMTPDMQMSAQHMQGSNRSFRSPIADAIPPPQVHPPTMNVHPLASQQHTQTILQQQQQLTPQQQQQIMITAAAMGGANFGSGMMSPQHQQQLMNQQRLSQQAQQQAQHQVQQQQAQALAQQQLQQQQRLQQMQQQQLQLRLQMQQQHQQQDQHKDQLHHEQRQTASELQMLQNKLAAIYSTDTFDPRPIADTAQSSSLARSSGVQVSARGMGSTESTSQKVEIPPGNNPRRMPPPSLLKRDDSLRMEKVFEPASPAGTGPKKKYETGNGSSAHLSAMSLSMGDLNDDGNLSQVFNSSVRISGGVGVNSKETIHGNSSIFNSHNQRNKDKHSSSLLMKPNKALSAWDASKATDKGSIQSWEHTNFDMSVATIGASTSDANNMSFATLGGPDIPEHEGNMSFSQVFEDPDKLG